MTATSSPGQLPHPGQGVCSLLQVQSPSGEGHPLFPLDNELFRGFHSLGTKIGLWGGGVFGGWDVT